MNIKIILLSLLFIISIGKVNAQADKNKPKSIIVTSSSIKKYYQQSELETMNKGELQALYIERIKVLVNTLPYIALATKPGLTMTDIGIPDDVNNRKLLDTQQEETRVFLQSTVDFQAKMLPYCDKGNLIYSILFYESTLKELNTINQ